jgi:hypothetical protein
MSPALQAVLVALLPSLAAAAIAYLKAAAAHKRLDQLPAPQKPPNGGSIPQP